MKMKKNEAETVQWSHAQSEGETVSLRCPHCGQEVEVEITGGEDTDSVTVRFVHGEEENDTENND